MVGVGTVRRPISTMMTYEGVGDPYGLSSELVDSPVRVRTFQDRNLEVPKKRLEDQR